MRNIINNIDIKRTIPNMIKAIAEEEDTNTTSIYENIVVSMYASVLLFIAAIASFIVRYFIRLENFKICLFTSLIFLVLGLGFEVTTRMNIESKEMTLIISALSFLTLFFVCSNYYPIIGPAIWTVAFIQLISAMVRITKEMLYSVTASVITSIIYIFYFYHTHPYQMTGMYYIVQLVLLVLLCVISIGIIKINSNRFNKIKVQYKELIASEENSKYLAYHDSLTDLPNRLFLYEKLDEAILLSKNPKKSLAVIFLDLDNFKMVNDSMGHAIGDDLIVQVSKRLINTLGKNDTIARIGGDEFIILIENVKETGHANKIAEKILESFNHSFILNNNKFFITTSIGISIYKVDGEDAEMLIKNADIAMYKAKSNGGNQYAFCTNILKENSIKEMNLINDLHCALEQNELELYYQPQVNSNSGKIIGLEALLRWNNPKVGMVLPGVFIPIIEKNRLINSIGKWALHTACKQNKSWQNEGLDKIPVAVNLSVRQIQDYNIVKIIRNVLKETGLNPSYLELEVTESIAIQEKGYAIEALNIFREMGISVSIDDFGTEYSSLNYLKQLPVDKIKIAMQFIQGISISSKDEAIIKAIIILAKSMGFSILAEGVETEEQLSFLSMHKCDVIQGFYYYKPMPAYEIEKLLKSNSILKNR